MPPVTWIIERDVFAPACFDGMIEHLREKGIAHRSVEVIGDEIEGRIPVVDGPGIVYGSIGVRALAQRYGWKPGVFGDEAAFNASAYADALGDLDLNAGAVDLTLGAVAAWLAEQSWEPDRAFFLKPTSDNKEFAGTVLTVAGFGPWLERLMSSGYLADDRFDVALSPARPLGLEWRVIVVDGQVAGVSTYRRGGESFEQPDRRDDVVALVREAHERFAPAEVYVVDVVEALRPDGVDLRIVEYNTFNSASLYACPVGPVIDAVTAFVERTYESPST